MTCEEVREEVERECGRRLSDEVYSKILAYTMHKAMINGKDSEYVPLLLRDEIRNHFIAESIDQRSKAMMEAERLLRDDAAMQGIVLALLVKGAIRECA